MKALVIIDCQERFLIRDGMDFSREINRVESLTLRAIEKEIPILLVEFVNDEFYSGITGLPKYSNTVSQIRRHLLSYTQHRKVYKMEEDGGNEIGKVLEFIGHPKKVSVCGAYAQFCVKSSVRTLAYNFPNCQFNLIDEAIMEYPKSTATKAQAYKELSFYDNIKVR